MTRCIFCGANGDDLDTITLMAGCNNCRLDLMLNGEWTGYGWKIVQEWIEKFGPDEVARRLEEELRW